MKCTRCEGLMLKENMIDMEAGYGEMWSHSWRCFNCGHRDDAVIRHHRQTYARQMTVSSEAVMVQEVIELSRESESAEPLAA
jgi:C4-type Zn-finger protein